MSVSVCSVRDSVGVCVCIAVVRFMALATSLPLSLIALKLLGSLPVRLCVRAAPGWRKGHKPARAKLASP